MQSIIPTKLKRGTFLVASPEIDSGLFFKAVLILCEHNPSGSFGLLMNRKLEISLPEEVIDMQAIANPRITIRAGGPVQPNQMMILHSMQQSGQQVLEVCDGVYLGGDMQFLQSIISDPEGPHVHLCFGYAGWTPGQLEREFLDGSWLIFPANQELVFEVPTEQLWRTLLRKMGGKYASLSTIPDDLSVN